MKAQNIKVEAIKIENIFVVTLIFHISVSCIEKHRTEKYHNEEDFRNSITNVIRLEPEVREKAGIVTEPVLPKKLLKKYSFSGGIYMDETKVVHVGSKVSGVVVKSYFKVGDFVRRGDTLALIDSIEVAETQNQYLRATSEFEIAQNSYERAKLLFEQKVISRGEFLRRYGDYLSAKSNLESLKNKLRIFGFSDKDISSLEKTRSISSLIPIFSPISGKIIDAHIVRGEIVESTKPLFKIADLSTLWVIANIPEKDISKVVEGQEITFTVPAYPDKIFRGKISYVSDIVDVQTRTVTVRAEFQNSEKLLRPGMFATIEVVAEQIDILAVPKSALQRDGGETFVFVETEKNTFEKRNVVIGYEGQDFYQITSGLSQEDTVVVNGSFILKSELKKNLIKEEVE